MRTPSRSIVVVISIVAALGLAIWGAAAAGAAHPTVPSIAVQAPGHSHGFVQSQHKHYVTLSRAQAQADGDAAARLANALFKGDLNGFNSVSAFPAKRQQDLDAEPERKDTLVNGPALAGIPTQDGYGNLVVHLSATAKAPSGKFAAWTLDIAVSLTTHKIVTIDAHRVEIGNGSGE